MITARASSIRIWATVLGSALALQAAWISLAELSRPAVGYFPDAASSQSFAAANSSTALAATIGWPRGDLWSAYVMTENATRIAKLETGQGSEETARPEPATATAVALAPYDARLWLVLAMQDKDARGHRALKMSYYTAPTDMVLFPLRIRVASRFQEPLDAELSNLVEFELAVALKQDAPTRSAIEAAYNTSTSSGRRLLERLLNTLDPAYAAQMTRK